MISIQIEQAGWFFSTIEKNFLVRSSSLLKNVNWTGAASFSCAGHSMAVRLWEVIVDQLKVPLSLMNTWFIALQCKGFIFQPYNKKAASAGERNRKKPKKYLKDWYVRPLLWSLETSVARNRNDMWINK